MWNYGSGSVTRFPRVLLVSGRVNSCRKRNYIFFLLKCGLSTSIFFCQLNKLNLLTKPWNKCVIDLFLIINIIALSVLYILKSYYYCEGQKNTRGARKYLFLHVFLFRENVLVWGNVEHYIYSWGKKCL